MGQLIQRWTRNTNQRFKNWVREKTSGIGQKVASKLGGLYKTAVLDPQKSMNLEMADYNYQKNLEMWNLQNQYNSPLSQRQRMEEAGFNPNYISGGGATGTGNASAASMPSYNAQAPQVDPMSFYGRIVQAAQGLMNIRLQAANVKKAEMQSDKIFEESKFLGNTQAMRKMFLNASTQKRWTDQKLGEQLLQYRGGGLDQSWIQPTGAFHKQRTAIDAQIDRVKADTVFRGYQNQLARYGIFNSSNPWLNLSIKALEAAGVDPVNWLKSNSQGLIDYMRSK